MCIWSSFPFVHNLAAYRFFEYRKYGQYTFSSSRLLGFLKRALHSSAALSPISQLYFTASSPVRSPTSNSTITESVSPYLTFAPGKFFSTYVFVSSIIPRPRHVVVDAIGTQGRIPLPAPVNPYTEFIEILYANCLPLYTSFIDPVAAAISFFAFFRNCLSSRRIAGKRLGTPCANLYVRSPILNVSYSIPGTFPYRRSSMTYVE